MPKVKVLEVNGRNIDITSRELIQDKVKFGKDDEVPFESEDVFNISIKKFKNKVALKRRPCLIHVKGKARFTKYKELNEGDIEGITNKDRKAWTMRSLARALTNMKPMTMTQFVILAGLLVAVLIISVLGFSGRI